MKNKVIALLFIFCAFCTMLSIPVSAYGPLAVELPTFTANTFINAPNGEKWTLSSWTKYIGWNLYALTPLYYGDLAVRLMSGGGLERSECRNEPDRLIYYVSNLMGLFIRTGNSIEDFSKWQFTFKPDDLPGDYNVTDIIVHVSERGNIHTRSIKYHVSTGTFSVNWHNLNYLNSYQLDLAATRAEQYYGYFDIPGTVSTVSVEIVRSAPITGNSQIYLNGEVISFEGNTYSFPVIDIGDSINLIVYY